VHGFRSFQMKEGALGAPSFFLIVDKQTRRYQRLTVGIHRTQRASLARRSTVIAGFVLLLFALGGNPTLNLLHISIPAFRVAGGLLLFFTSLESHLLRAGPILDQRR
jgi:small neutral amino acid transporter SnatA (MarC family)